MNHSAASGENIYKSKLVKQAGIKIKIYIHGVYVGGNGGIRSSKRPAENNQKKLWGCPPMKHAI